MSKLRERDIHKMNTIPPLVIEEARKIKDLPFERLIVFNRNCTSIFATRDGNATGVPMPASLRSQAFKKPTLHNHPFISTSHGMCTSAIPSIGDILGAIHYLSPYLYVCDRDKITKTIPPRKISEDKLQVLQHLNFFGCSFVQSPHETIEELIDIFSSIILDFRLFDINTLKPRNDFMTQDNTRPMLGKIDVENMTITLVGKYEKDITQDVLFSVITKPEA